MHQHCFTFMLSFPSALRTFLLLLLSRTITSERHLLPDGFVRQRNCRFVWRPHSGKSHYDFIDRLDYYLEGFSCAPRINKLKIYVLQISRYNSEL